MSVEVLKTEAERGFATHYSAMRPSLPGNAAIQKLREAAWETYSSLGLPHRRVEEWKYTDLRAQLREAYPPAPVLAEALTADDVTGALGPVMAGIGSIRLVIVDGQFRAELSDADDLADFGEVLSLSDIFGNPPEWVMEILASVNPQDKDPVIALNTALMSGGLALRLNEGAFPEKPIHIVHVHAAQDPAGLTSRNVISVGNGANVMLLESYVSASGTPAQRNGVTELAAGDGATVHHLKYQGEAAETAHLTSWLTRLGADAVYRAFQFSTGAAVARNQLFVEFAGEGASSHINSAVLGRGKQHNDTTIVVDHAVPACESREFNKLVLDEEARGIVQCKVNVHRDAQKSDGHQTAHGLLLSERAEFDSKPELEIFADDVVCGHGSTSGQVDEDLMFYLRARGIPEPQARALLIKAFVGEVIERLENEAIQDAFLGLADSWLAKSEV